jgi:hypothetical protein
MERNLDTEAAIIINDLDSIEKRIEALQANPSYTNAGLWVSEAKSAMKSGRAEIHRREMEDRLAADEEPDGALMAGRVMRRTGSK